jgi:hypothetical protein
MAPFARWGRRTSCSERSEREIVERGRTQELAPSTPEWKSVLAKLKCALVLSSAPRKVTPVRGLFSWFDQKLHALNLQDYIAYGDANYVKNDVRQ